MIVFAGALLIYSTLTVSGLVIIWLGLVVKCAGLGWVEGFGLGLCLKKKNKKTKWVFSR